MGSRMVDLTARHLFGTNTNYAEWGGRIAQMYTSGKELLAERDRLAVENGVLRAALEDIEKRAKTGVGGYWGQGTMGAALVCIERWAHDALEQADKIKGEVQDATE